MGKFKLKSTLKFIPLLIWSILIIYMSHQTGSESINSSNYIVSLIKHLIPLDLNILSLLIRKLAHIIEYFILTYLFSRAIKDYTFLHKNLILLLYPLSFAISDEIHQLYIFNRAGIINDVFIDFIGILLAYILIIKKKRT